MPRMFAGFAFGTTITSRFRVKTTGFEQSPFAYSWAGSVVLAAANTSAGGPRVICAASAFDPPNEYRCDGSSFGKASVNDDAAYTVRWARRTAGAAVAAT